MPNPKRRFGRVGGYLVIDPEMKALLQRREIANAFQGLGQVVYFVRCGEYIKIGTTGDLLDRRRHLVGTKLTDILAVLPGGRDIKREMHQRCALSLAKDKEWFHPSADLINYINQLRDKAGVDPIRS